MKTRLQPSLLYWAIPLVAITTADGPHTHQGMRCFAQGPAKKQISAGKNASENLAKALDAIRRSRKDILAGFTVLEKTDFGGKCPDQLLALVHSEGEGGHESIWRFGMLVLQKELSISGRQLVAEYDKAGKRGRRARQALCALAAYQTGRHPPESIRGEKPLLPKPKPLDQETLALLVRALAEDDPAVRVAAADSVRLAGIADDRFLEPLRKGIADKNTVVSEAASLAAAELGFASAGRPILHALERRLEDPRGDCQEDLNACGLPLARQAPMSLWGDYYSPRYGGGGWIPALAVLRYRPALPLLRKIAVPYQWSDAQTRQPSGAATMPGWEHDLAKAIVDIENRPHRPAALLQLAEDKTLAGDVRAAALEMLDECDVLYDTEDPATGVPVLTGAWRQYYEPGILRGIVNLIDEPAPITVRGNEPGRLGRLAIEVTARKFSLDSAYHQTRLHAMGKPSVYGADDLDEKGPAIDLTAAYPPDLLPIRRQLQEKLQSLLPGSDGALALEALAVAIPEWGTAEEYLGIASDPKQKPLLRLAAANLLTWQPAFLEMDGGGTAYGKNAPPETAGKLLPLLEIRGVLKDSRRKDRVTHVFLGLLGFPSSELTAAQKAARRELLPKLRAMRNTPHADAALDVLLRVYDFSRPARAWDARSGDPADGPEQPAESTADARVGPPPEVMAQRSFDFGGSGIRLFTLAQHGKTLVVGDGSVRTAHPSGSRVVLLDPRDLREKATISISDRLPWSSHSAVPGRDGEHVLVFNRFIELSTLKTVGVLDVNAAVSMGNVTPQPLAISPDGKSALVYVSSYLGSHLDALGLFDLEFGKLQRTVDIRELQPISNACFLDEKTIAVHGNRGCVLEVNLDSGKQRELCDRGPRTIVPPGVNWHMAVVGKDRYLVVSGHDEFVVIDVSQAKEVFRKKGGKGNAVPVLGGRFLLYQAGSSARPPAPAFFCSRLSDGKIVAVFPRDGWYDTLMPGEQDDIVYAVNHDTLSRLRFRWGGDLGD